ncbi:MAG: YIP1 family protein [Candidatus Methanoperedens sp.]|nr:YIP1 family protein [Candidatus Methanoperedens sp.]
MVIYKNFIEKLKGIILEPSTTFEISKQGKFGGVAKYYIGLIGTAVMFSLIFALWWSIENKAFEFLIYPLIMNMIIILFWVIFWILLIFIVSAIFHIVFHLSGGKTEFTTTLKVFVYSLTPILLIGWMSHYFFITIIINEPQLLFNWKSVLSIIAWIWSTVLLIIGLQRLHEITKVKALMSGILVMVILLSINYYFIYIIAAEKHYILIPFIIGG